MTAELRELIRFLESMGDVVSMAAVVASLPVLAFILWLALPRRGP